MVVNFSVCFCHVVLYIMQVGNLQECVQKQGCSTSLSLVTNVSTFYEHYIVY